ncbi:MAG: hypothetical protein AB8B99_07815 [Phormidesmis sp.]
MILDADGLCAIAYLDAVTYCACLLINNSPRPNIRYASRLFN